MCAIFGERHSVKRFRRLPYAAVFLIVLAAPLAARAQNAANLTATHLYAGTLAQGESELTALLQREPKNAEARFGLGSVKFVRAVERLGQSMYRHGLEPPRTMMVPMLRLPVPRNPNPAPLTYEDSAPSCSNSPTILGRPKPSSAARRQGRREAARRSGARPSRSQRRRQGRRRGAAVVHPRLRRRARPRQRTRRLRDRLRQGRCLLAARLSHLLMAIAETGWRTISVPPSSRPSTSSFRARGLPYAAPLGGEKADPGSADYPVSRRCHRLHPSVQLAGGRCLSPFARARAISRRSPP